MACDSITFSIILDHDHVLNYFSICLLQVAENPHRKITTQILYKNGQQHLQANNNANHLAAQNNNVN